MAEPLKPADRDGESIVVGSLVLIPTLPDWLLHDLLAEDVALLRTVEGSIMRVTKIDSFGYVWFSGDDLGDGWFCLRPDEVLLAQPAQLEDAPESYVKTRLDKNVR
jgi:hypothetical protein